MRVCSLLVVVMAQGRGRCGELQTLLCTVGVTVAVLSAGAGHRRRTISSDTRCAGGCCAGLLLRGASCWQLWVTHAAAPGGAQPPCCAVLSLFLAVARHLYAHWKCVECSRCVGEHYPSSLMLLMPAPMCCPVLLRRAYTWSAMCPACGSFKYSP